jgi:hypothetical protein
MGEEALRRHELAAFLRSRRERVTPEDAGLPSGYRRRTAGLRREEVAQLSGVGVTWYTWLEQGRPIRASVQVLEARSSTVSPAGPRTRRALATFLRSRNAGSDVAQTVARRSRLTVSHQFLRSPGEPTILDLHWIIPQAQVVT